MKNERKIEVLSSPKCILQFLELCKLAFDEGAQKSLEAVEVSNPHIIMKHACRGHNEEVGPGGGITDLEHPEIPKKKKKK